MNRNIIETITGMVVLLAAGWFVFLLYNKTGKLDINDNYYNVTARFNSVEGLFEGSEIRASGIKIGIVKKLTYDPENFQAVAVLSLEKTVKLPKDTAVKIVSDGLLGSKFITIEPGNDQDFLQENDNIRFAQSSVNLESLIGKMMFGKDK